MSRSTSSASSLSVSTSTTTSVLLTNPRCELLTWPPHAAPMPIQHVPNTQVSRALEQLAWLPEHLIDGNTTRGDYFDQDTASDVGSGRGPSAARALRRACANHEGSICRFSTRAAADQTTPPAASGIHIHNIELGGLLWNGSVYSCRYVLFTVKWMSTRRCHRDPLVRSTGGARYNQMSTVH